MNTLRSLATRVATAFSLGLAVLVNVPIPHAPRCGTCFSGT